MLLVLIWGVNFMTKVFRKGLGVIVGALAATAHFTLGNIYKEWFKLAVVFFLSTFFFTPLGALAITGAALGGLLAYKSILNFYKNVDATDGKVVEHTPLAESMLFGCGVTNNIAGPTKVHSIVDKQHAKGRRLNESYMQKVIDAADGIAYSAKYRL